MLNSNKLINISILIPIYNAENTIEKTLQSILGQTIEGIEIICVDDGSTDNSYMIVKRYAEKFNQISLYQQEHSGVAATRNYLLKLAKGKYVAFMDADDWYPTKDILSCLYLKAKKENAKICGGSLCSYANGEYFSNFDGEFWGYSFKKEGKYTYKDYQFDFGFQRFLYNREFLMINEIKFPKHRIFEDVLFFVQAMNLAGEFYAIPQVVYCYRSKLADNEKYTVNWYVDLFNALSDGLRLSSLYQLPRLHELFLIRGKAFLKKIVKNRSTFSNEFYESLTEMSRTIDRKLLFFNTSNIDNDYFYRSILEFMHDENVRLGRLETKLEEENNKLLHQISVIEKEKKSINKKLKNLEGKANTYNEKVVIVENTKKNEEYIKFLQQEIENIRTSTTFKIGRIFMCIPGYFKDKYILNKRKEGNKNEEV